MKRMEMANIKKAVGTLALSTVLAFGILLCSGCATASKTASKTLTDEEIAGFNTEFFNAETNKMNNMLLSSEYDTPEEIDLFELFYNGFYNSVSGSWSQAGEEEVALLAELDDAAVYLDVMKVTAEEMEAALQEKSGLSLEETQKKGLENFYYLEEYDSYYLVHGDTNFDWCTVTSGIRESGDRLTLEYTKEYEGGQWTVTLKETDGGYRFVSNKRADTLVGMQEAPVSIQVLTPEDAKIIPEIVEYDYESACKTGEVRQMRGMLPGMGEGIWYTVMVDGVEYYYARYDDSADKTELFGYAIVSGEYSLANGISVGMTKSEVIELCPAMAMLDTEGNALNEVVGHMGWNSVAYPHSSIGMDEKLEYVDGKDYYWENQFDYIMIADVEQTPDSLPLYAALMMKDDAVLALTFYYPTAG